MKMPRLAHAFICFAAYLSVLAAFAVLDWFPTVKALGGMRRERSELQNKIKNRNITLSGFTFSDQEEEKHFSNSRGYFSQALPRMEDDTTWLNWLSESIRRRAEKDKVAGALLLLSTSPGGELDPAIRLTGHEPAAAWLAAQLSGIRQDLPAASPSRFPWKGLFADPPVPLVEPLASRPLVLALAAPLPNLLNFINHCSWKMRLEIVRLHLQPGPLISRAWLVCRSTYLVRKTSPWVVKVEPGDAGEGLLVDLDSDMLWQKVDPSIAYRVEKKELPPVSGWNLE